MHDFCGGCGGWQSSYGFDLVEHVAPSCVRDLARQIASAHDDVTVEHAVGYIHAYVSDTGLYTMWPALTVADELRTLIAREPKLQLDDRDDNPPRAIGNVAQLTGVRRASMAEAAKVVTTVPLRQDVTNFFRLASGSDMFFICMETAEEARRASGYWYGTRWVCFDRELYHLRLAEAVARLNMTQFHGAQTSILTPALLWLMYNSGDDEAILVHVTQVILSWMTQRGNKREPNRFKMPVADRAHKASTWHSIMRWIDCLPPKHTDSLYAGVCILRNVLRRVDTGEVTFERSSENGVRPIAAPQFPKDAVGGNVYVDMVLGSQAFPDEVHEILEALQNFGPVWLKYDTHKRHVEGREIVVSVIQRSKRRALADHNLLRCTSVRDVATGLTKDVPEMFMNIMMFAELSTHIGHARAANTIRAMWNTTTHQPTADTHNIPVIETQSGVVRLDQLMPLTSDPEPPLRIAPTAVVLAHDACECFYTRHGIIASTVHPSDDYRGNIENYWGGNSAMPPETEERHHYTMAHLRAEHTQAVRLAGDD